MWYEGKDKRTLVFGGPSFMQARCTTIVITRPHERAHEMRLSRPCFAVKR